MEDEEKLVTIRPRLALTTPGSCTTAYFMTPNSFVRRNVTVWVALIVSCLCSVPVLGQDALAQIKARGELIISTDATYPPFEYKDQGKLVGFDIDLGDEIGKRLGVKVTWLPLEWTAVLGSLEAHKADLILSGMTITDERKKGYTFSRPYFLSGQSIARRDDDPSINSIADLKSKTVSVQDETTGMYAVQKIGVPNNHIMKFDQLQDALLDVRNHRSDAAVADLPALKRILRMSFPDIRLVGGVIKEEYVGAAARHGELALAQTINGALNSIISDGTYGRIYTQWIQEPVTPDLVARLNAVQDAGSVSASHPATPPSATSSSAVAAHGQRVTIRWDLLPKAMPLLLLGAEITLVVTVFTLLFGVTAGLLIALARIAGPRPLRAAAILYVEVVRGTPLLMQIYAIYFVLPAFGISLAPIVAGISALTLNAAAYISEIFRAGIESIDTGQMEAARALGMDYRKAMRWVILPQTIRRVLPPLTNEAVALLKDSSLVSVIAVSELMRVGKEIAANTGAPTTLFLVVALIYLAMTLPLTTLVRRLETSLQPISGARGRKRKGVSP